MVFIWQIYVLVVVLDITGFAYYCFVLSRMAQENGFERSSANFVTFKSLLETALWVLVPILNIIFLFSLVFNGDFILSSFDAIIETAKENKEIDEIIKDLEEHEKGDDDV